MHIPGLIMHIIKENIYVYRIKLFGMLLNPKTIFLLNFVSLLATVVGIAV